MIDTEETKEIERQLTLKQRKWLKLYLEIGNATEAAMQVYDCKDRDSAKSMGWENLTKLDFAELMEESGLTDDLLQQKIMEGLVSNRVISAQVIVKSTDPKVRDKTATARDVDFIDVPDMAIRHKYLETALKLKKRLIDRVDLTTKGKEIPTPIYGSRAIETV